MNGVGLTTVGRLLGHRKRRTTAIYAHLDDAALHDAAARAAAVIAAATGYRAEPPPLPDETDGGGNGATPDTPPVGDAGAARAPSPDTPQGAGDRGERGWGSTVCRRGPRRRARVGGPAAWSAKRTPALTRRLSPKRPGAPAVLRFDPSAGPGRGRPQRPARRVKANEKTPFQCLLSH